MGLQPPSHRVAAGTRCAPPAPRTPVRPAARAGPPATACIQAVTTRAVAVLCGSRLQPYCVGACGGRTSCRRDTASTWRAAAARVRALVRRVASSAASARASASAHLLPSCTALGPSSRSRASTSSRTCTRLRKTGLDGDDLHACASACMSQRTADSTSHCSVSRCTWPSSRRTPSPSPSRASRTWYVGRQPRIHGVAASGAWAAAFGTLGLQSLIHAVAALRAHLVLLAPPPRLRRRAPRLHQLGRRRALLLRCRRAHHRCPQLGG